MKKILVVMIGAFTLICTLNACALPNAGKVQVIASPEPAGTASTPEVSSAPSGEGEETPDGAGKPAAESTEAQGAATEENGSSDILHDEKETQAQAEEYGKGVMCTSTIIAGNNMIVQVRNTNEITIPKVTVALNSPEDSHELVFYQVSAGKSISIPIEKKPNELPPAVNAEASVSMEENEYVDITKQVSVSVEQVDGGAQLTVSNGAAQACKLLNITVKFANNTDIVYAQMRELQEPIGPGESVVLSFLLPQELKDGGTAFDRVEYVLNQAVA